ncbi:uncharacterized protein E0L32_009470 [Thyridium curvatum]|uniref:SnoaL-like domain-containing protein n=1 Tax=Thyridium curvatum TaxID=1093900 RepID=A0A507AWS5_9PEZI|nr:uncharacterized protein E0L32_009470 [Thyridium curvatum]TPX09278.1 hypothetical protein E0L32_009470 [Thyridium curvatum]
MVHANPGAGGAWREWKAWYYDTVDEAGLTNEVFAPGTLHIDYTSILGGQPFDIDASAWTTQLIGMLRRLDGKQHLYTAVLAELPQPGAGQARPETCKAYSQGGASMVVQAVPGGHIMQNGAQATFEMVRVPELEAKGLNPWRIRGQTVNLAWQNGNKAVVDSIKTDRTGEEN